jgi:hypothetical protein
VEAIGLKDKQEFAMKAKAKGPRKLVIKAVPQKARKSAYPVNHFGACLGWLFFMFSSSYPGRGSCKQRRLAHPPQPSEPVEKPRKNSMVSEVCRDSGRE